MPLGQGWLNAWVKVNNKHVVYKRGEEDGPASNNNQSIHQSSSSSQHSHHSTSQTNKQHPGKSSGTISSGKTAKTAVSEDVESQTIQRVNNRKHRRRLHKTKSASDLIRDQAKNLGGKTELLETVLDVSTSTQATAEQIAVAASLKRPPPSVNNHRHHHAQGRDQGTTTIVEPDEPLRFVAGLLGADLDKLSLEPSGRRMEGDESINFDTASLQWVPQTQQLDAESLPSRGGYSLPARAQPTQDHLFHRSASNDSASKGGFRFPSNIFSNDNNNGKCRHCTKFETELAAARDDMEYLRSVGLRNEYTCSSCNTEALTHPEDAAHPSSSLESSLRISDRLLDEVTARHKAQLEQLTKDRVSFMGIYSDNNVHACTTAAGMVLPAYLMRFSLYRLIYIPVLQQRWQHDAHVKLQKYAGLCQDLNEEATIRNEEVISLHKEVGSLRLERDQMAAELETARATIAQHERDAQERKVLETKQQYYESKGLDEADAAIKKRDAVIEDLSTRLRKTLDILEVEREQQRQRRQIIFPSQRVFATTDQQDLYTELKNTRASLEEVRSELHSLQRTSQQREAEWMARIESLERQLKDKV